MGERLHGAAYLPVLKGIFIAGLYVAAAKLGFWLSGGTWANITPVWPPTGIALATILYCGNRFWPAITFGAFVANFWTPAPASAAILIATGNTLEALFGAYLVRKFDGKDWLETFRGVMVFIFGAAIVATTVSATIGVSSLRAVGMVTTASVPVAWLTWWLGDLAGALVVAPVCLSLIKRPWRTKGRAAILEFIVLQLIAVVIGVFTFTRQFPVDLGDYALTYVLFPFLIWAAVRFELWGASMTTFIASCVAIWGTTRGSGPYASTHLSTSLTLLMAFIGVAAVTGMILAAAIAERRRAEGKIRELIAELEQRVDERGVALEVSQEKLRQSERLASIGTLASGIAHEINNPAASILAAAQLALEKLDEPEAIASARKSFRTIVDEAKRCGWIVKNLLQFARTHRLEKSSANLNRIVESAVATTSEYLSKRGAHLTLELDPTLPDTSLNPTAMEQVVVNLLRNAAEAGQGINVLLRTTYAADSVRLIVSDNGPGLSGEMQKRILDPFFTTRVGAGGTGLGLSICHGIVTQHSGSIEIESEVGGGTSIAILLPLMKEEQNREAKQEAAWRE